MPWQPTTYLPPEMLAQQRWEDTRRREICISIGASVAFAIEGAAAIQLDLPKIGFAMGVFSEATQLRAVWVADTWEPPASIEEHP